MDNARSHLVRVLSSLEKERDTVIKIIVAHLSYPNPDPRAVHITLSPFMSQPRPIVEELFNHLGIPPYSPERREEHRRHRRRHRRRSRSPHRADSQEHDRYREHGRSERRSRHEHERRRERKRRRGDDSDVNDSADEGRGREQKRVRKKQEDYSDEDDRRKRDREGGDKDGGDGDSERYRRRDKRRERLSDERGERRRGERDSSATEQPKGRDDMAGRPWDNSPRDAKKGVEGGAEGNEGGRNDMLQHLRSKVLASLPKGTQNGPGNEN